MGYNSGITTLGGRAGGGAGAGRGAGGSVGNAYDVPKGTPKTYNKTYMNLGRSGRYSVTWQGTGSDGKPQMNIHFDGNAKRINKFIKQNLQGNGYTGNGLF